MKGGVSFRGAGFLVLEAHTTPSYFSMTPIYRSKNEFSATPELCLSVSRHVS